MGVFGDSTTFTLMSVLDISAFVAIPVTPILSDLHGGSRRGVYLGFQKI